MALGEVKWFNTEKGYGFIAPDEGGKDVFVHISEVGKSGLKMLTEGQRVEFELVQRGDGRTSAVGLHLVNESGD